MVGIAFLFYALSFCCPTATAEAVYQGVGPDGSVTFSDEPFPGSKRIRIEAGPVKSAKPITRASSSAYPAASGRDQGSVRALEYKRARVLKPTEAAVFWSGNGEVPVELSISPPLQRQLGHQINVLLDGQPYGPQRTGTDFLLQNVPRGSHTLKFQVVGTNGRILAVSPAISFQLHRPSVLNRRRNALGGS